MQKGLNFRTRPKGCRRALLALSRLQKTISKLSKEDQEDLPQEIQDEIQKANDQLYEHQKWTVDFFVTGWKHQTLELPELQGKPSSYFKINEIPELATAIQTRYLIKTEKTDCRLSSKNSCKWNCTQCDKSLRKSRGCRRPVRHQVWVVKKLLFAGVKTNDANIAGEQTGCR